MDAAEDAAEGSEVIVEGIHHIVAGGASMIVSGGTAEGAAVIVAGCSSGCFSNTVV